MSIKKSHSFVVEVVISTASSQAFVSPCFGKNTNSLITPQINESPSQKYVQSQAEEDEDELESKELELLDDSEDKLEELLELLDELELELELEEELDECSNEELELLLECPNELLELELVEHGSQHVAVYELNSIPPHPSTPLTKPVTSVLAQIPPIRLSPSDHEPPPYAILTSSSAFNHWLPSQSITSPSYS